MPGALRRCSSGIGIVSGTATCHTLVALRATAATPDDVADTENGTIGTIHRQRIAIAVSNRAGRIHSLHTQNVAHRSQALRASYSNSCSEAIVHGEIGRIVNGDEKSTVAHKLLQVLQPGPAKTGAHVVRRVNLAEVWRQRSCFPGNRISI